MMTKLALLIIAVALLATLAVDGTAHAQATVPSNSLDQLNTLKGKTIAEWSDQYDSLRKQVKYNWVDWSQDKCSSPVPLTPFLGTFTPGCLRHDMMWRTLPIADAGTGKIWNERNRLAADNQFQSDLRTSCRTTYTYEWWEIQRKAQYDACIVAADKAYGGVRNAEDKYDDTDNPSETSSVRINPAFANYPVGPVNCALSGSRCLPVHYITLNGRPLSPQNIPYIATDKTVALQVVRGRLQSPLGAPSREGLSYFNQVGDPKNTGELLLRVNYPLRVSTSSTVACPASRSGLPQRLDIDSSEWPVDRQPRTPRSRLRPSS